MKKYSLAGFNILEFEELESTNTMAVQLPKEEVRDGTVVLTHRQLAGRGQGKNRWECEPGKNLSMTVIFQPEHCEASHQFAVSMVIALACRDFVSRYTERCTVKWPNDVYVGDKKIAGILIEHSISGRWIRQSVCGIGLNINQPCFYSDAPNPVSLYQLTGREMRLSRALEELLGCISERYGRMTDYESLERDYLESLYRREGMYTWEDANGRFEAVVAGVDEYGRLVLRENAGQERIYGFKEVKFC